MVKLKKVKPIDEEMLKAISYTWNRDEDGSYIVKDNLVVLSEDEADEYYKAANTLYEMYENGAEYVIKNNLFEELDIPPSMVNLIKHSWKFQRGEHLYGRFDFSGGVDGLEIKLIEFNADTPTLLLETSLVQLMILEYNNLKEYKQFNNIYEAIVAKYRELASLKKGEYSRFLFSSVDDIEEEISTTKLLQKIADDAGCITNFSYLDKTYFSEGAVLDENEIEYDYWFKLYPWEEMADLEPDLLELLKSNLLNKETNILNPAYTLLFQSKGMLKILYDLYPDSPYLLKTSFKPLKEKYVKKNSFGREGANIDIVENGEILHSTDGIYDKYKPIYQAFATFAQDTDLNYYQAGVFFSGEACGVGFRRGSIVLDDMSQFVGHIVI